MMRPLFCLLTTVLFSGCVYSNIRMPLDEDLLKTEFGSKTGISSNYSVLWLVAWGDAGVKKAADNGGLKVVNHVDMGVKSFLFGLYTRRDTIAYGD